jgi:ribonucleotide reductase beta subunit family protein with ferritin-like domain
MKHKALVIYEFLSLRGVWVESSTDYYVNGTQIGFLDDLVGIFSRYNGNYRIKSIIFFESYV